MRVLLIDGNALLYRAFDKLGHLKSNTGEPTGVRYQFLRVIRAKHRDYRADKIVIAWDSPGKAMKAVGVLDYKANRIFTPEKAEMYSQLPALQKMLALTCYTQAEALGFEADDIIGSIARKMEAQGHIVYILSPDNDFLQLVSASVTLIQPVHKKDKAERKENGGKADRLVGPDAVLERLGVKPAAALLYRAMKGDASDNLKTGVSLNASQWDSIRGTLNAIPDSTYQAATADAGDIFRILLNKIPIGLLSTFKNQETEILANYRVMKLYNPETLVITKGTQDLNALTNLLTQLGMKSLLKNVDHFTDIHSVLNDNLEAYAGLPQVGEIE